MQHKTETYLSILKPADLSYLTEGSMSNEFQRFIVCRHDVGVNECEVNEGVCSGAYNELYVMPVTIVDRCILV